MGTIQSLINQLALNGPQVSIHTVTHNHAPVNHYPEKTEPYFWMHGQTRNNEQISVTCRKEKTDNLSTANLQNCGGGSDKFITTRNNV